MSAANSFHLRYQSRWLSGQRPNFEEALSRLAERDLFPEEAFKLAKVELRFCLLADHPRPLDDILRSLRRQNVDLARQQLGELALREYLGRWERGETATRRAEYVERFPELKEEVAEWHPQWECPNCPSEHLNELDDERAVDVSCSRCSHRFQTIAVFSPPDPRLDHRPYELIDEIGTGGMGVVYRAVDPALSRELALKKLHPRLVGHREAERRFEREASILGDLQHPGIVPLHSFGRLFRRHPFFTMKLVRGRTFDAVLQELSANTGPSLELRINTGLEVFEKVCQAIAFAHERRVVHRDLKPTNFMVGQFGEVQVMDWGLAKRSDASGADADDPATWLERDELLRVVGTLPPANDASLKTSGGQLLGTIVYMPREQALDASSAEQTADVFALGAILCEILTGAPPCLDVAEFEQLRVLEQRVAQAHRARIAELNAESADPSLAEDLQRTWEQACQERDRYASSLRLIERVRNRAAHVSRGLARLEALEKSRQPADSSFQPPLDSDDRRPQDPLVAHLTPLVRACLADDPAARPANAGLVEQRLREYFQAVREDAAERRLSDVRRRQSQVVVVLVSFLALVALGAALWVNRTNIALQRQTRIANERSQALARQVVQRYLTLADAERDRSEGFLGLPWLGAALRETRDPDQRVSLRRSIQTTLPMLPKVRQIYLHDEEIRTFEYGGGGTHIVTSAGKFAHVWPVVFGQETTTPVLSIPHEHDVFNATLNMAGDRLLTMSGDGVNRLYSFPDGRLIHTLEIKGLDIQRSSFDRTGQWCFGAAYDPEKSAFDLFMWDAATGQLHHRLPHGKQPVTTAVLSPEGTHLATIAGDATAGDAVWLWKLSDSTFHKINLPTSVQTTQHVAFSHNGKLLATGGLSQEVKIWEVATGVLSGGPLPHAAAIQSLEFSQDDELLVARTQSDTLHLWDWKNKKELPALEDYPAYQRHPANVVSADHRHVLVLDPTKKALRVWSFGIRGTADFYLQQPGQIDSLAVSPDDQYVALVYRQPQTKDDMIGRTTLLVLRRSEGGRKLTTIEHASYSDFTCAKVAFSPDSRTLWVSGSDVLMLDLTDEKPDFQRIETPELTFTLHIAPDGRSALVHGFGNRLYHVSLSKAPPTVKPVDDRLLATFSPAQAGEKILIMTTTEMPSRPQAAVISLHKTHAPVVLDVAPALDRQQIGDCTRVFTPTSDKVIVLSEDGEAVICDTKTGQRQATLRSEFGAFQHAQFDPRGRFVLAYTSNHLELYRSTGERLQSTAFNNAILRANFSPDGSMLVVASGNLVQVRDVATWEPITPFWDHKKPVADAQFTRSGQFVAAIAADHSVRLWSIADKPMYTDEQLAELADFWSESTTRYGRQAALTTDQYRASWRNVLATFPQWSRSSRLEDAQFHWEQIAYCEAARDWKTAAAHWQALLTSEAYTNQAAYWQRYGFALAQIKDWPAAEKAMRRASELAPDNPFYMEWLAYSQVMKYERVAGAETYRRAEALGQNNAIRYRNMATNFAALGDYAAAAAYFHKVRLLEPHEASNWRNEGAAWLAAGKPTEFKQFAEELAKSNLMESSIVGQAGDVLAVMLLSPQIPEEIRPRLSTMVNRVGPDLSKDVAAWLYALVKRNATGDSQDAEVSVRQSLELQKNQVAPRHWLLLAINAHRQKDVKQRDKYLAQADAWLAEARASQAKNVLILTLLETEALRREYASLTEQTSQ